MGLINEVIVLFLLMVVEVLFYVVCYYVYVVE